MTTIVNTVNNDAIGDIVKFAAQNIDKVQTIAFQPVSFTGRDEDVSDKDRIQQRYTLAGMTHDLKDQLDGTLQPLRDWFPLSVYSAFTSVMDMLQGADAPWGWSSCNCHPNCGIFTLIVVNKQHGRDDFVVRFFQLRAVYEGCRDDYRHGARQKTDDGAARHGDYAQLRRSLAPEGFPISQILNLFKPSSADSNSDRNDRMKAQPKNETDDMWRVLCVEGMWFQDLFNYDFRRTEMCVIPYGTQEGEISFCAYNTGVGWRQIIEEMHKTASLSEWYQENGRHAVYAKGKEVPGIAKTRQLSLPVIAKIVSEDLDAPVATPYLVEEEESETIGV